MSDSGSKDSDPNDAKRFYSRKEKSLGVLCTNFLKLYNKDGVDLIGLDDAANKLGVERRRIYDVVNILESLGIVARKQKNQYSWKGFDAIPDALKTLKEAGCKENSSFSCSSLKVSGKLHGDANNNENIMALTIGTDGPENSLTSTKSENRREKSLRLLTQNFIKLFLCSDRDMISLDDAARALLGVDGQNSAIMRTKVRRLYDITNVFSSMNLIEKKCYPDSRKPAYRWLGWGKPNSGQYATGVMLNEANTRVFGTNITSNALKTNKMESPSLDQNLEKENIPFGILGKGLGANSVEDNLKQQKPHSSKFVFGPFAPPGPHVASHSGSENTNLINELEDLASVHYPRYLNQAANTDASRAMKR